MNIEETKICCSIAIKDFALVKYHFEYSEDKQIIDLFVEEGLELAKKLDDTLARDSSRKRGFSTIQANAIAGNIAEYVWREWLKIYAAKNTAVLSVNKTEPTDIKNQIDIEIVYGDTSKKSLEVRSSFPYTGIQNGVCRVFDIIGWYVNEVKRLEVKKDYYTRCLFPYYASDFLKLTEKQFDVYLTGGATKLMLETSSHAKDKEFIPFDERDEIAFGGTFTKYRVIEPIINADNTVQISEKIIKGL
ncbi:MAG: hypothetical protein WC369_00115 [Dehalococcoidales bacterium]|jgi:hypothetical protein